MDTETPQDTCRADHMCSLGGGRRMLQALLSDRGLDYLVSVAALELGNPIVVVDPSFHFLARAGFEVDAGDKSTFAQAVREEDSLGSIIERGIDYIAGSDIDVRLARTRGPVVRENPIFGCNTMTQRVLVHGVCLARVMMVERNRPFSDEDEPIFAQLVALVGQELQKSSYFSPLETQASAHFLSNLLADTSPYRPSIERRMRSLGLELMPSLTLVVLSTPELPLGPQTAQSLMNQLTPIAAGSLSTLFEGRLVLLMSKEEDGLTEYDIRQLERIAATNTLNVGVSNTFSDICQIRRYLSQAVSAIRFGSSYTKVLDDTRIYPYNEYNYFELLDNANGRTELLNYCHPKIWRLWEHDQAHDSELTETLYAYMQNGCNTARTALLLSLHKNTLLYRLGRIKEIMGCDLSSGEDLFLFHLSIRVLIFMDLLEPRTRPRTSADLHAPER